MALVTENAILFIESFNDIDSGSDTKFARFLKSQVNDDPNPYEKIYTKIKRGVNIGKYSLGFLFSFSKFKTKAGKDMGSAYFFVPEYGIMKITLFDNQIMKFETELENDLSWKVFKAEDASSGRGFFLKEISDADKFCRERGLF
jgi:hypothetical protein